MVLMAGRIIRAVVLVAAETAFAVCVVAGAMHFGGRYAAAPAILAWGAWRVHAMGNR